MSLPEAPSEPVRLPTDRPSGCPFDPPAGLAELRARNPLQRMLFPDGHRGRLATGYDTARAILADPRFSSRVELAHYPFADIGAIPPAPLGDLTGIDAPEHTRYRRLLAGKFTARRMRLLTEGIERITADRLDAIARCEESVDLVQAFAFPIPALTICRLLGIPFDDEVSFQRMAAAMGGVDATPEQSYAAYESMTAYLRDLVRDKMSEPTDDLLGDLAASGELTFDELAGVGAFLLAAGLDTTANMLALGTYALLTHRDQFDLLCAEPGLAAGAVEELMRYLSVAHTATRVALTDVEVNGQVIGAGETVAVSLQAANRDPARFDDPDVLDVRRDAMGHLGFGHGAHLCLGQQLARVEMRVALPALASRFPTLRLAVDPVDIELRQGTGIHGVDRLPVTW
ncbi:cytochrome P450 [Nocardia veterana]|uniref:Cytochrome P450 n=1 Tax=Nocardia veterana TaxID=132249 RepID=A0A7X6RIY3_9NOCA|nr:cytochrome P450 [Nocardia veterana]NKY87682.1 cytochrome P450 [Nocardia veterana]